ncbi:F-box/FBD/LRR-repeat protein At3g26920-like [Vicia villosa]|uniref:F-box/FBD/LRR-repeat protein At3g26920-like n=1 Tax=Vicia villosa TaxID=3911 RepID=UPI00273BAE84|nr:F-box/FBD/LRR-repeat protein At3g26920-like [Vicia villosa]
MKRERLESKDRLSALPDCILLLILSFLSSERAVQTCILSPRWNHLWKCLPTLRLNSFNFKYFKDFTPLVTLILSLRDNSTALHTLTVYRDGGVQPRLLKRVINYGISHNVQHLDIYVSCNIQHFPRTLFSSHTLTSLKLLHPNFYIIREQFPYSLNLPSLTELHLHAFAFPVGDDGRVEPFSTLHKLNTLIIDDCHLQNLCILSTSLARLTIVTCDNPPDACCEIELSTPNLCIFSFIGSPFHKLYGIKSNLSSIKHIDIDLTLMLNSTKCSLFLLNCLVELVNVKSITVSSPTLQVLSLVDLFKIHLPSLCKMKSLKVKKKQSSFIPDLLVEFLLQNSPSTKVDIID